MCTYRLLVRPWLFALPPEVAHSLAMRALQLIQSMPGLPRLLRRVFQPPPCLTTEAMGLQFPCPIGVAAGFDKDAKSFRALGSLGFGFVEVGTVTPKAQPGNPRPRVFRMPDDRALVNQLGFNNSGATSVVERLAAPRSRPIVGGNIGKGRDTPVDEALRDYMTGARQLAPFVDYLAVNVSSPNTPGLQRLQGVDYLREILLAVREEARQAANASVPVLVKISADLAANDVDDIADLILEQQLEGIIACNTTATRTGLQSSAEAVSRAGRGGLSGAPLAETSIRLLKQLSRRFQGRATIISVGGIQTAEDVHDRLQAGATLVQVYSTLVYDGPGWIHNANRTLAGMRGATSHRS